LLQTVQWRDGGDQLHTTCNGDLLAVAEPMAIWLDARDHRHVELAGVFHGFSSARRHDRRLAGRTEPRSSRRHARGSDWRHLRESVLGVYPPEPISRPRSILEGSRKRGLQLGDPSRPAGLRDYWIYRRSENIRRGRRMAGLDPAGVLDPLYSAG